MFAGLKGANPLCWYENSESRGRNQDFPGDWATFGVRGEVRSGDIGRAWREIGADKGGGGHFWREGGKMAALGVGFRCKGA